MTHWIDIGHLDDVPRLGARIVELGKQKIAIFRTSDDAIFAVNDRCPHKGGVLSQGIVTGHSVTCPLHGWNIQLESGCATEPNKGCVRKFPIKVENGQLFISLTPETTPA
ncbi:NAD(P)H-dependent nitrite reductase, small subunit [Beggiatoa alba B18LD]|uniref:NAD(P)H-dependent nitrite reductase, small subunit n=1 Tax=Beggiatoa alba B18LD TaxID=395493 RepID=I3CF83_9GAMM|nr:nitrite reductase small subunit NirD [Beggiatoa alba]EIJ42276.1 NAD(P)H-dependent nitrite reductase, small subunit [Beggiatoa alba B18LD]